MSNSPLVSYTRYSPNHSGRRTHAIDTVTIHCMAGNMSVESCGALFANPETEASSNYGVGSDGRIALYVDEENRSWCSSNAKNDNRAVTIEVANTVAAEPWPVSDEAYAALIDLLTDICQRNGIKKLLWKGDKSLIGKVEEQNMTVHRWFAAKACPGDWLYSRHGQIAAEVNERLEGKPVTYEEFLALYRRARDETDPYYAELSDVPEYWRGEVEQLLAAGAIRGNGKHPVGKRKSELAAMIPAARYAQALLPQVQPE